MHFNVTKYIGEIENIVKNKILASTSVLSYLDEEMIKVSGWGTYMGYFELNGDLLGLKLKNKWVKICYFSHFWRLPTLDYYRAQANTKKILIYDVDFIKGYNIYQYRFGIHLCFIQAKCWKLSKMQKMTYFYTFL